MKKTKILMCLAGAIMMSACVGENDLRSISSEERYEMAVNIAANASKAVDVDEAEEKSVNDVQVLAFRQDGKLDAYAAGNAATLTISCTQGQKRVYAMVNCPSLAGVLSESQLLKTTSLLKNNAVNDMEMTGMVIVDDPSSQVNPVSITVERLMSRVVIEKISNKMTAEAYRTANFVIEDIYLINVAATSTYDKSVAPSEYFNKMKFTSSEVDALLYDSVNSSSVAYGSSYSTAHYLYAYPNPSTNETQGGSWSPRVTRLVVKIKINETSYFYPISLPAPLVANKSYEIKDLVITRPGSASEDEPVSSSECSFTITVKDWTVENMGDLSV